MGIGLWRARWAWPATSSAGSGSSNHTGLTGAKALARRQASSPWKAWLASTMMSQVGPTVARTASSRSRSSCNCGRPTFIFAPWNPSRWRWAASSHSVSADSWSHPPSVLYTGTRSLAPPASRCSDRPVLCPRRSHSAMSMAARARAATGPTVNALTDARRSRQTRSMLSASAPISLGNSRSRSSATTEVPPAPIV